jgi:hypothetical protein
MGVRRGPPDDPVSVGNDQEAKEKKRKNPSRGLVGLCVERVGRGEQLRDPR